GPALVAWEERQDRVAAEADHAAAAAADLGDEPVVEAVQVPRDLLGAATPPHRRPEPHREGREARDGGEGPPAALPATRARGGSPPPAVLGHVSAQDLGHLGPPGGLLVHDSQACYPCRPRTPRPALMRTSAGALRRAARLRPWLRDRRRPL